MIDVLRGSGTYIDAPNRIEPSLFVQELAATDRITSDALVPAAARIRAKRASAANTRLAVAVSDAVSGGLGRAPRSHPWREARCCGAFADPQATTPVRSAADNATRICTAGA